MMRSLYSAVSGLKTHQTRMDVIGNNIANVNTQAFKASSVTFSEIMYQTTSSASAGNIAAGTGGVNAKQIGLGVTTGSTTINITGAGAAETTGNPFDLKLTDSQTTNFFVVSDGVNTYFTRAGSFYVDGNGYLCMSSTGYTLMGWQVDPATGDIRKDTVSPLQIMSAENQTSAPEATTDAYISGVLDKNDTNVNSASGYAMNLGFYDDLGYSYTAKFAIKPTDSSNGQYMVSLTDIIDQNSVSLFGENGQFGDVDITSLFGRRNEIAIDASVETRTESAGASLNDLDTGSIFLNTTDSTYYVITKGATQAAGEAASAPTGTEIHAFDELNTLSVGDYYEDADGVTRRVTTAYSEATATALTIPAEGEFQADGSGYFTYVDARGINQNVTFASVFGYEVSDENDLIFDADAGTISGTSVSYGYDLKFNTSDGSFDYVDLDGSDAVTLALSQLGLNGNFSDISMDFSKTLNYNNGGTSTMKMLKGDTTGIGAGKKLGALTGLTVDSDGKVYGSYDNGNTVLLCQIAAAQFANASGLEKVGENCYQTTLNSGEFDGIGVEINADGSGISTGELEMSNVDLSAQFTDMIITQRGFQANSRVITTSDTLLEELINLKR